MRCDCIAYELQGADIEAWRRRHAYHWMLVRHSLRLMRYHYLHTPVAIKAQLPAGRD
jgi:hypothetical protein